MRLGAVGWELMGLNIGNGGHMWSKHRNSRLIGRLGNHVYKTVSEAMTACIGRNRCKGVTKEGHDRFGMYTGNSPSGASGKTCYVKGEVQTIASGKYFIFYDKRSYLLYIFLQTNLRIFIVRLVLLYAFSNKQRKDLNIV